MKSGVLLLGLSFLMVVACGADKKSSGPVASDTGFVQDGVNGYWFLGVVLRSTWTSGEYVAIGKGHLHYYLKCKENASGTEVIARVLLPFDELSGSAVLEEDKKGIAQKDGVRCTLEVPAGEYRVKLEDGKLKLKSVTGTRIEREDIYKRGFPEYRQLGTVSGLNSLDVFQM